MKFFRNLLSQLFSYRDKQNSDKIFPKSTNTIFFFQASQTEKVSLDLTYIWISNPFSNNFSFKYFSDKIISTIYYFWQIDRYVDRNKDYIKLAITFGR